VDFDRTRVDLIPGRLSPTGGIYGGEEYAADELVTPSASLSSAEGNGGSFRITAKDQFGNNVRSDHQSLQNMPFTATMATMYTPVCNPFSPPDCNGDLTPYTIAAVITAVADGTFNADFASTLAGEYVIALSYSLGTGAQLVEGYPVLVQSNTFVRPGATSVPHSYPLGAGLEGGLINTNVTFGIQACDMFGNLIYRRMTAPFLITVIEVSLSGDGATWNSEYNYDHVFVEANSAAQPQDYSTIAGYGDVCGEGQSCSFLVNEPCHVCGTYTIRINVPTTGEWKMTGSSGGVSLATAPGMGMYSGFTMRFVDQSAFDDGISAQHSVAMIKDGVVGQPNTFMIQARTRPSQPGREDTLEWPFGGYQVRVEVVSMAKLVVQNAAFNAYTFEICTGDIQPQNYIWTTQVMGPTSHTHRVCSYRFLCTECYNGCAIG
jgi:hypothetical protein